MHESRVAHVAQGALLRNEAACLVSGAVRGDICGACLLALNQSSGWGGSSPMERWLSSSPRKAGEWNLCRGGRMEFMPGRADRTGQDGTRW